MASPASAFEVREGTSVTVGPNDIVDDDLLATGQTVTIAGRVTGDVIVFAQSVNVTGQVDGDLIGAAQQVVVTGRVGGDTRLAGNSLSIEGSIGRNFLGAGNLVTLGPGADVQGSWTAFGSGINVLGNVRRSATLAGDNVSVLGTVGTHLVVATDSLVVGPGASIGGDVQIYSQEDARIDGQIGGQVLHRDPERYESFRHQVDRGWREIGNFVSAAWLIGTVLLGAVFAHVVPGTAMAARRSIVARPVSTFGVGIAVLIGAPILMLLLAVTLVGIPLAVVSAVAYVASLFLGWILFAIAVATLTVDVVQRHPTEVAPEWLAVIGLLALFVLTRIPVLGGLISFVGLCLGLGALAVAIVRLLRRVEGSQPV